MRKTTASALVASKHRVPFRIFPIQGRIDNCRILRIHLSCLSKLSSLFLMLIRPVQRSWGSKMPSPKYPDQSTRISQSTQQLPSHIQTDWNQYLTKSNECHGPVRICRKARGTDVATQTLHNPNQPRRTRSADRLRQLPFFPKTVHATYSYSECDHTDFLNSSISARHPHDLFS